MPAETFTPKAFSAASLDLIEKANAIIDRYAAQGYDLSLRQLFYQLVTMNWLPNTEQGYKRLGAIINDARLAGLIDWDMIRDRGRVTVSAPHWDSPGQIVEAAADQFRIDRWAKQPNYVEVMVEKDALSGVLLPVCRDQDVRFSANKGYSSSSALYEASKRFIQAQEQGKVCWVLYLGDHDPSGLDMTRDVLDRLDLFTYHYGVEVSRLALNMDQIQRYNPPPNPAKMTDSRVGGYIARYGEKSWELDALDPSVLADLVRDAVTGLRDAELWEEALAREDEMRRSLLQFAGQWQNGEAS